jgi:hypothetical protein
MSDENEYADQREDIYARTSNAIGSSGREGLNMNFNT